MNGGVVSVTLNDLLIMQNSHSYDRVPFISFPSPERHPRRFAAVARLFGIDPQPLTQSAVLEIGCGTGQALLAMAAAYPSAHFVGIDSAAGAIEAASRRGADLNLVNLEFINTTVDRYRATEKFHYILCHGLYSWAPTDVREAIFACCSRKLASNGVAYISYSPQPAWHTREVLRKVIDLHDRRDNTPQVRIDKVRLLLRSIAEILTDEQSLHAMMLAREIGHVQSQSDGLLYHELLNPDADGIFEGDFRAEAAKHNLAYLAEAQLGRTLSLWADSLIPAGSPHDLIRDSSRPELETLLTCLFPASIRGSLLCRATAGQLGKLRYEALESMSFLPLVGTTVDGAKLPSGMFVRAKGAPVELQDRRMVRLLEEAAQRYPTPLSFDDISQMTILKDLSRSEIYRAVFDAVLSDYLDFFVDQPPACYFVGDCPTAFIAARHEAVAQDWVTNLRHEFVPLNPLQRMLLPLVDGSRSVEDLRKQAVEMVARGDLAGKSEGVALTESSDWREIVESEVEHLLVFLAQSALLQEPLHAATDHISDPSRLKRRTGFLKSLLRKRQS